MYKRKQQHADTIILNDCQLLFCILLSFKLRAFKKLHSKMKVNNQFYGNCPPNFPFTLIQKNYFPEIIAVNFMFTPCINNIQHFIVQLMYTTLKKVELLKHF